MELTTVKENQKQLFEDVKDEVHLSKEATIDKTVDIGHGRIETRIWTVVSEFQFINNENK